MRAKVIRDINIELKVKNVLKEIGYPIEFQEKLPEEKIQQVKSLMCYNQ